ncbi:hypothetical protein F8B43_2426 [Methylorubrum populi]|uniref:Uncharacterized protein n=1 Tax=Methylorubrum populi TaxID=223967 RepID=A0A833MZX9_9HYPH|nr:hypothetical protein F8B43_2426 [Methylorubrum populi]
MYFSYQACFSGDIKNAAICFKRVRPPFGRLERLRMISRAPILVLQK